ncbi:hypothetical protein K353_04303 [Kitasatospora sp. SolWspMP-SS2h]|uniref:hypothetical protein n=1 Tax=Kitasatospora sp. SolWspMP-SS2h TaxID=1305729 RepID=UPI000DBA76BA|nr:hypothetical protein [Kitasatospora sp. SolWspMP-SS2h]RAJ38366.1 hypothetical protein K353_04303 [Kitasatospora sp. SolWspMP-SS2h]
MDLEHDLSRLLGESVDGLASPVDAIVAEAGVQGRRLRRRRRLRIAGATAVVAALAIAGAVAVPRPVGGPAVTGTPPAATTTVAAPSPVTAAVTVPVTAEAMLKVLADLLPPGGKLGKFRPGPFEWTRAAATDFTVEYDDGRGAAHVYVVLSPPDPKGASWNCDQVDLTDRGARPGGAEPAGCTSTTDAVGTVFSAVTGVGSDGGYYFRKVRLERVDGTSVDLVVGNGPAPSPEHPFGLASRPTPPLTTAAWQAIVRDPAWRTEVPATTAEAGAALAATLR